jgi:acetyltransferase-like isoleucine patch superfamily enzyme
MNILKVLWLIRTQLVDRFFFGKIGAESYIGNHRMLEGRKRMALGKKVRIYPYCRIEVKKNATLVIGDNTSIGNNLHISCCGSLVIGNDVTISSYVFIGDSEHGYDSFENSFLNNPMTVGKTAIGDGSFIGRGTAILAGSDIGKHCVIGCNSVVKGRIPDYSMAVGSPAKVVKRFSFESKKWEAV